MVSSLLRSARFRPAVGLKWGSQEFRKRGFGERYFPFSFQIQLEFLGVDLGGDLHADDSSPWTDYRYPPRIGLPIFPKDMDRLTGNGDDDFPCPYVRVSSVHPLKTARLSR